MRLIKKQGSLVKSIAYMGIMAAINIIFVLLTYFIPFLLFLLVFLLPLCSAIISYCCKKYYFPIYLIVVSAVCLLIDPSDTIFYVIPSLLTGFVFGLFLDSKVPPIFVIVLVTLLQFGLSIAFIPLIQALTNRDIVIDFSKIFGLSEYQYLDYLKYSFIFFVAFAQMLITYLVMESELSKFGIVFEKGSQKNFILDLLTLACLLLTILFGFVLKELSYIPLFLAIIFAINRLIYLDYKFYKIYLIEGAVILMLSIFLVALLYPVVNKPLGLLLIGFIPLFISLACLINNCLLSKHNKDTINK